MSTNYLLYCLIVVCFVSLTVDCCVITYLNCIFVISQQIVVFLESSHLSRWIFITMLNFRLISIGWSPSYYVVYPWVVFLWWSWLLCLTQEEHYFYWKYPSSTDGKIIILSSWRLTANIAGWLLIVCLVSVSVCRRYSLCWAVGMVEADSTRCCIKTFVLSFQL